MLFKNLVVILICNLLLTSQGFSADNESATPNVELPPSIEYLKSYAYPVALPVSVGSIFVSVASTLGLPPDQLLRVLGNQDLVWKIAIGSGFLILAGAAHMRFSGDRETERMFRGFANESLSAVYSHIKTLPFADEHDDSSSNSPTVRQFFTMLKKTATDERNRGFLKSTRGREWLSTFYALVTELQSTLADWSKAEKDKEFGPINGPTRGARKLERGVLFCYGELLKAAAGDPPVPAISSDGI